MLAQDVRHAHLAGRVAAGPLAALRLKTKARDKEIRKARRKWKPRERRAMNSTRNRFRAAPTQETNKKKTCVEYLRCWFSRPFPNNNDKRKKNRGER